MELGSILRKKYICSGNCVFLHYFPCSYLYVVLCGSSRRLPHWIKSLIPRVFYVTEKAWNYYPRTTTEYTVSIVCIEHCNNLLINYFYLLVFIPSKVCHKC